MNVSKGNMYDWVTHQHSHLGGECPHKCSYCYVDHPDRGRASKYCGELRLIESEFKTAYGRENTIFIEHCNDLFCKEVPTGWITRILAHCYEYPENKYMYQTKNPARFLDFINILPPNSILGTTIETDSGQPDHISKAPSTLDRAEAMAEIRSYIRGGYIRTSRPDIKIFVTIEPIMDFNVDILSRWITSIRPDFLNIGADSMGHGLIEPTFEKIIQLVERLRKNGVEVRKKHNLERLEKLSV
jgi:DNA repair photolyase